MLLFFKLLRMIRQSVNCTRSSLRRRILRLKMCKCFHTKESSFLGAWLAVAVPWVMIQQWILELNSEKKILAIGGTSQHGSLQARDRTRKLRLVDQGNRYFERDFRSGIQITARCQQYAAGGKIQRSREFEEFLACCRAAANEEGNGDRKAFPAAALGNGHSTTHARSPRLPSW